MIGCYTSIIPTLNLPSWLPALPENPNLINVILWFLYGCISIPIPVVFPDGTVSQIKLYVLVLSLSVIVFFFCLLLRILGSVISAAFSGASAVDSHFSGGGGKK